jgi:hypothetical protein
MYSQKVPTKKKYCLLAVGKKDIPTPVNLLYPAILSWKCY